MSTDALATCVGHLVREWGDYGYRITSIHPFGRGGGAIGVRCSDGGEFFIGCGPYGESVCHADTLAQLVELYRAAVKS